MLLLKNPAYTKPDKSENAALFLLSTKLIRHENGAFRKRSSNLIKFENTGSAFLSVDGKHFENRAFRKV